MLTALKSGVKFLTKSEVKCVFHHTSVCFYYFFDKSLENSDLDRVLQDISKLNTHVQSRQKSPLAGRQQAWLRKIGCEMRQRADQRSPRWQTGATQARYRPLFSWIAPGK
ncbi:hypothetical protein ABQZ69_08420 [Xanthomonas sp. WHRI 8391]|uniref:Uncharacterized protein n=1 Tax=Xanthomonas hortorum TaxID=56454 RepID=A0AA47ERK5_9XANT|nr:hypothetical protein [Xanthomonas hortorum]MBG3851296.1 hypothetical protein [Xanthomonas hortorum pv. carotae]UTS75102.1 hypothetical protein NMB96_10050 [Xanthomonas hortorum]WAH63665.1 hypothetical protein OEG85_19805 [Xanthomonas hortorum]